MAVTNRAIIDEEVRLRDRQDEVLRRVNSIQGRPPTNAELSLMRDLQEAYTDVYRDLGLVGAPGPLGHESADGYRRRLAAGLQPYAKDDNLRAAKIAVIPHDALPHFEKMIYADAQAKAADRTWSPKAGQLREIRRADASGRENIEFAGDPLLCSAPFMRPRQYLRDIINPSSGRSYVTGRLVG